jgi:hypothetical protein
VIDINVVHRNGLHYHEKLDAMKSWKVIRALRSKQLKYDPNKIIAEFARLNSLRRSERILKNNCAILEKRISADREVVPLLQQIRSMEVGIDKLISFSIAVNEKARASKLWISAAA